MKVVAFRESGAATHHLADPVFVCKPRPKDARSAVSLCNQEFGPASRTRVSLDVGDSRRCVTCSAMAGKSVRLIDACDMRVIENRQLQSLANLRRAAS